MDVKNLFKQCFPKLAEKFSLIEFQESVIQQVLTKENTLCIMQTGGGKSLTYWLSGLGLQGITLVISPLTALIDEQAIKLEEHGYKVLTLHAGIDARKQLKLLKAFYKGELNPDFIFVSPERISTDGLFEFCIKSRKDELKLIAIDEIHCVSQWGHSFRPFYKHIPTFLNNVYGVQWPTVLGLSATLNRKEVADICDSFKIKHESVLKSELLVRTEIELKTFKFIKEDEKLEKLWKLLTIHQNEKTLVYIYRVKGKNSTEELAKAAIERGIKATHFHGDVSSKDKQDIIERFKNNKLDVVFATNAFGMGIDIPDIRVVIHFMIPESVAQYYQEVGRASRDKQASNAYLLYSNKNIDVKKSHFIDKSFPTMDELKEAFSKVTSNKIGYKTLSYFDDEDIQKCLPYFIDNGVIEIVAKGITSLDVFSNVKDTELANLISLTKTKNMITTMKKSKKTAKEISDIVFNAIVTNQVIVDKSLGKCLVIKSNLEELDEPTLQRLEEYGKDKKSYKHAHLNYFVHILENCDNSRELHQEIGRHLGVPKFLLSKIYATTKGDLVRSKSEVIIANLLHQHGIFYEYEKELYYGGNKRLSPDFTLAVNGKEYYWEHLGMIGKDDYDTRWLEKQSIYQQYFPDQLIITYENPALTKSVESLIKGLLL
ncbi:RecQ family ATP-dependent DNA helicase [Bacillus sp. sid0103]|uniref:RecQ family ATP-dependent DNA helicase n=1 Tax=Bacillus sp. sid0103 TaxID=2856337 RepID=UPI001C48A4DE|nr:RecQ family ATP-dependent DNA helicase [Bacillus sp. sid0103]MBV7504806.1 RecQ family ATP-dependent DNA helicase [Bacillus sp. sid0103]